MTVEPIYLDHNATTPLAEDVLSEMWPYLTTEFANASSATPAGARARNAIDRARERVAALIDAHPDEIVFTPGGTEAINLAIRGVGASAHTAVVVTSAVEHPATVAPIEHLRDHHGWRVHMLGVDIHARLRLDDAPAGAMGLGTLILAHNETGTIQPVASFASAIHAAGGVVHADAAQAVGKIPVSGDSLGVDLLSIAGHKMYAPKGIGALYVRRGVELAPLVRGAGQERGLWPGTENVAGIVGLGAAAECAGRLLETEPARQAKLREQLWESLRSEVAGLVRVTPTQETLPNTLMVAVPGVLGADILASAPAITASTGSACHSGVHTASPALSAAGIETDIALGALRLSLGTSTTSSQIESAAAALAAAIQAIRGRS